MAAMITDFRDSGPAALAKYEKKRRSNSQVREGGGREGSREGGREGGGEREREREGGRGGEVSVCPYSS